MIWTARLVHQYRYPDMGRKPLGHLRGQKQASIPIGEVNDSEDGVRLNLTKDEAPDLPPVELHERGRKAWALSHNTKVVDVWFVN